MMGNINKILFVERYKCWTHKYDILKEGMGRTISECLGNEYQTDEILKILYDMKDATSGTMERYFYHPDHLGSSSWVTDNAGKAIQHLHYLPFGEDWVEQRTTSWCAPYTFSAKEKDQETGYSYVTSLRSVSSLRFGKVRTSSLCTHSLRRFGARYYDSNLSIWLSVDPMSEKYPYQSNYIYCSNNPIRIIDPDGMDEWEFDTKMGTFTWLSDKGGSKTDHYNIGQKNEEGEFNSDQTISIDRNGKSNINSFRIEETRESTISAFHIPDAKEGELSSGFFLEPKGPSTEQANQNQRIPEGSYDLMINDGKDYPGVPKLFNSQVSKARGILIHIGNSQIDTRGCLLIGANKGKNWVGSSGPTLDKMNNYINKKGYENVRLNIFNVIK